MIGLDTSVVIRLLTGEPAAQAEAVRARVVDAVDAGKPVVVTDLVIAETYHALHYHYAMPKDDARALLARFLDSGVVASDPAALATVATDAAVGAGLVDRLIHERHRQRGAVTLTFDKRQAALEGAEQLLT